jgi:hypothetical protein
MSIGNRRTDIIAFILMVSGGTFRMNHISHHRIEPDWPDNGLAIL